MYIVHPKKKKKRFRLPLSLTKLMLSLCTNMLILKCSTLTSDKSVTRNVMRVGTSFLPTIAIRLIWLIYNLKSNSLQYFYFNITFHICLKRSPVKLYAVHRYFNMVDPTSVSLTTCRKKLHNVAAVLCIVHFEAFIGIGPSDDRIIQ